LTEILDPVWPLDQFTVQLAQISVAVKVTDWPGQSAVLLLAEIVGANGAVPTVTDMPLEDELVLQLLL
jgi:hypothetical protein